MSDSFSTPNRSVLQQPVKQFLIGLHPRVPGIVFATSLVVNGFLFVLAVIKFFQAELPLYGILPSPQLHWKSEFTRPQGGIALFRNAVYPDSPFSPVLLWGVISLLGIWVIFRARSHRPSWKICLPLVLLMVYRCVLLTRNPFQGSRTYEVVYFALAIAFPLLSTLTSYRIDPLRAGTNCKNSVTSVA